MLSRYLKSSKNKMIFKIKNQLYTIIVILNFNHLLLSSEKLTIPFSFLYGMGFEETNTKWDSFPPSNAISSQNYEHIKFLLFQGQGTFIRRNVFLSLTADYGIFGKGEVENIFIEPQKFLPTSGFLADGTFTLGYLIPITPDRPDQTCLIPEGGYSSYWLKLNTSLTHFKELWHGPFLGGALQVTTRDGMIVFLKYNYHWLTLHHTLDGATLKFHHAYGHEAELNVQTYLFQNIKLGAALHYIYYRNSNPTPFSAQREDLSISLQFIYDF